MMIRSLLLGLSALAIFAATAQAQDIAADYESWSTDQWRTAAEMDVREAYREYVENHPGMFDAANPGFPAQLEAARDAGLAAAAQAQSRAGYARALAAFSAVLSDGHAVAIGTLNTADDAPRSWPGFAVVARGDRFIVATPDASDPLAGALVTGCNGEAMADFLPGALLLQRFRANEAGQWWSRPSQAFFSIGEVPADAPRECTFRLADGTTQTRTLDWREPSRDERDFYAASVYSAAEPTGLTEPRPGLFLIGLGDFQPDEAGRAAFEQLYADLAARRDELLAARAVVIDMRGNNGGSSGWSQRVAAMLWGEDVLESRAPQGVEIDWRTSPETIAYLGEMASDLRAQGSEWADMAQMAGMAMEQARQQGQPLWRQPGMDGEEATFDAPVASDFTTPVYVINWGLCASACLDANDYFARFANTVRIGAPTSADSTYMEVRRKDLPGGPGYVVIPNKTWVGRPRGWGEVYAADIPMAQADWSTAAFLDRIEADMAGAPR
ncbi:hypothetical protein [Aurantiacibacter luteus]|uniref:Tail specific protease domain-containing protein n=1 Tax=Aurantiacibacter luteus TaxID=1581420 RepID=A0A0G9MVH5_9SPHN|nr:hypothetical protein [Aurantiacibacter luteus]KLE34706.1 hypothetical protein AAW00_11110 [Aurantiacibacter luteus]